MSGDFSKRSVRITGGELEDAVRSPADQEARGRTADVHREAMHREAFDLVLMDANMPVMDGIDAVRAIRALAGPRAASPIYMLTANAFEEDVQRYLAAGVDGVLAKPIDLHALYGALAQAAARVDRVLAATG